jgi:hypothetical protein
MFHTATSRVENPAGKAAGLANSAVHTEDPGADLAVVHHLRLHTRPPRQGDLSRASSDAQQAGVTHRVRLPQASGFVLDQGRFCGQAAGLAINWCHLRLAAVASPMHFLAGLAAFGGAFACAGLLFQILQRYRNRRPNEGSAAASPPPALPLSIARMRAVGLGASNTCELKAAVGAACLRPVGDQPQG